MNTKMYIEQLLEAEKKATPLPKALSKIESNFTEKEAYEIQMGIVNAKLAAGERIVGKKIGFTSKAMQEMFQISEPDFGHLFDTMLVNDGHAAEISKLIEPKVEGEIAFILKEDIKGPNATIVDAYGAIGGMVASIEVVDSRFSGWNMTGLDSIADNAANARFVLGDIILDPKGIDLRCIGMYMKKNGKMINSGTGIEVMGNPINSLVWLANKLAKYDITLKAGEVILTGAVTGATAVERGDLIEVCFDRIGSISLKFE